MVHRVAVYVVFLMLSGCGMPQLDMPPPLATSPKPALKPSSPGAASGVATTPTGGAATVQSQGAPADPVAGGPAVSDTTTTDVGGSASRPAALMLNEILYDIPGSDTNGDVFIELRGTPGGQLEGYFIRLVNGDGGVETARITLPAGLVVPDDGLVVIADDLTGDPAATHVSNTDYITAFDPQNGPDAIQLFDPDGFFVDVVGYGKPLPALDAEGLPMFEGEPAVDAPMGSSISRPAEGEDTDQNQVDFMVNSTPSPGTVDVVVPGVSVKGGVL